jgi:phage head maturation protease
MAVDLYEVTITADPAYEDTEIGMRSLEEARSARKTKNFNAAAKRVARKMTVDLRARRLASKA